MLVTPHTGMGRGCLGEEGSAVGGSGTADVFLAFGGLLRLTLDWFEVHVNWMHYARGGDGGD